LDVLPCAHAFFGNSKTWLRGTVPASCGGDVAQRAAWREGAEGLMESAQQGVVSRNTVNTHILHLRKKFKAVDAAFDRIGNEYALGYRWIEE
jgi:hypothetical protein